MNCTYEVTTPAVNEPISLVEALAYLGISSTVSTTLNAAADAEDTTITVADSTGFSAGQTIAIGNESSVITSISSNTLTISALAAAVTSGSAVTTSDSHASVLSAIKAATAQVEAYLNRALLTQTIKFQADYFPNAIGGYSMLSYNARSKQNFFTLPRPKLQSVTTFKYYSTLNVLTDFSSSNYYVDSISEPSRLVLNDSAFWPTDARRYAAIEIVYNAGYGSLRADVPSAIREAIKLQVAYNFETEAETVTAEKIGQISFNYSNNSDSNSYALTQNVLNMLKSYRVLNV